MDEKIFEPDYGSTKFSDVSGKFFLGIAALVVGVVGKNLPWFLFGSVLFFWGGFEWISYPKMLVFNERGIVIKRNYLPSQSIAYRAIIGIGDWEIGFGNKRLPFGGLKNLGELNKILDELIDNGMIRPEQLNGELISNQTYISKTLIYTVAPALVFGTAFVYLLVFQIDFQPDILQIVILFEFLFAFLFLAIKNRYKVKK